MLEVQYPSQFGAHPATRPTDSDVLVRVVKSSKAAKGAKPVGKALKLAASLASEVISHTKGKDIRGEDSQKTIQRNVSTRDMASSDNGGPGGDHALATFQTVTISPPEVSMLVDDVHFIDSLGTATPPRTGKNVKLPLESPQTRRGGENLKAIWTKKHAPEDMLDSRQGSPNGGRRDLE